LSVQAFREQLLAPRDWFAFWRINCRLATFHSLVVNNPLANASTNTRTNTPNHTTNTADASTNGAIFTTKTTTPEGAFKHGYEVEDKWTFLLRCRRLGVPHTPWLECDAVVCKHRNEEGGLGYVYVYNHTFGLTGWWYGCCLDYASTAVVMCHRTYPGVVSMLRTDDM
jgi:hypothetical protein